MKKQTINFQFPIVRVTQKENIIEKLLKLIKQGEVENKSSTSSTHLRSLTSTIFVKQSHQSHTIFNKDKKRNINLVVVFMSFSV